MESDRLIIERMLLEEHSKDQTLAVARFIGGDADRFAAAWEVFCNGAPPLPQRMAWVLDHLIASHPLHAVRYARSIIDRIPYMAHPAELRSATKILATTGIPEGTESRLLEMLYPLLLDPQCPVAIRVHCLSILYQITQREPDLKRELLLVLEELIPEGSPALINRGRKLQTRLQAEIRKMEATQPPEH